MPFFAFFNENPIKIRDMRVDFYTYDVRKCGQGAKRRARTLCE
jgi:hypothetical protein